MNKLIKRLPNALDPLFSSVADLQNANKDDIVSCTVLCTRAKIYSKGIEVMKLLKKKKYNELSSLISRVVKLISIHRNQLYKLTKKTQVCLKNFLFLKDLKTLFLGIQVCFGDKA
jgi:hypothetical protein